MNYFKAAEQVLAAAPTMVRARENLERRKARLAGKDCPRDIGALDYDKPFVDSHAANDALSDLLDYATVCRQLADTEAALQLIDDILDQLEPEKATLLRLWYMDRLPKERIMERLYISSPKAVYSLRNRAVAEFALLWFGADALHSI